MPTLLAAALALQAALGATALSPQSVVATAHPLASQAGVDALRAGGNAVDAAVAAALALGVVQPESSGLGGGGFALVWRAREQALTVLDFREVAPAAATRDMFLVDGVPDPRRSRDGGLSVAVPGAPRGYAELARRFGRLPLTRLAEPAARLAEHGFAVGRHFEEASRFRLDCLVADGAGAREFLVKGANGTWRARRPGERLRRPELARTLRLLGRDPEALTRGALAARVAAAVRARGGVLTAADLAAYATVERAPLWGAYRGHRIASMPPPSAGGAIVLGLLQALEGDDLAAGGFRPVPFLHAFVEVEKRLFAERAGRLADPAFLPGADAAARELADPAFARALRAAVGERATPSDDLGPAAPTPRTCRWWTPRGTRWP
jgi:gamma-glutamyltranspeptidase/glutathione hydrolase